MVADAGLAEKQRREFFQRPGVETLKVPVGLVVAQPDAEAVDLRGRQRRLCIAVGFFELPAVRRTGACQTGFLTEFDNELPS